MSKRSKHAVPHFNDAGGCICVCRRCVRVRLIELVDQASPTAFPPVRAEQFCCCRKCNESCPGEGRSVRGYLMPNPSTRREVQV